MKKSYSKIRHIQESNVIIEQRRLNLLSEQENPKLTGLLSSGYKDVTAEFNTPEGKVLIPDGNYVIDGGGGVVYISQNGKNTGYAISDSSGIRTILNKPVKVSSGGVELSLPSDIKFGGLFFNQQIYNQFIKK